MRSVARFRVIGMFDFASKPQVATIEIDRCTGLVTVRPLHRKVTRTFALSDAMSLYYRRLIAAEVAEKKRNRKKGRAR